MIDKRFALGTRVKFRDGNATGFRVCLGEVNGTVYVDDRFIPIFTSRRDREPTTVFVDRRNVIDTGRRVRRGPDV